MAIQNGFDLIRIDVYKSDYDYIKAKILESKLSDIFDLRNIDWDIIYRNTITSLYVQMAEYYMEHKELTLKEICNHFNVSQPTLRKALEKLSKVGLCDYQKRTKGRKRNEYQC